MTFPLRIRLSLLYVAVFALIVAGWSVFVVLLVRADLYTGIDRALASRASQIALSLSGPGEGEFRDISDATLVGVARTESTAQLLSPAGAVLESSGDTMSATPLLPPAVISEAVRSGVASIHTVSDVGGETFRVLIAKDTGANDLIVVGTSTESADNTVDRLILIMLLSGPIVLVIAGIAGWIFSRRALAPVAKMTAIADSIGIEALEERVPVPAGRDELAGLATTLNNMLDRLETGVRAKRRLVADASHELQTPLAVMRTELDVSLASGTLTAEAIEVLESTREETDHMVRIVRNLLTLARFDEGTLRLLRIDVDLHELAEEVADSLATLAREASVRVDVTGEPAHAQADPEYVRVALVNLLENAIKYSGEGAFVTIETSAGHGDVTVTVADSGPGIPAEALPRIFDRFYRVDRSRAEQPGGSGLGLAICREIVSAHGGSLEVVSAEGAGSRFSIHLPRL